MVRCYAIWINSTHLRNPFINILVYIYIYIVRCIHLWVLVLDNFLSHIHTTCSFMDIDYLVVMCNCMQVIISFHCLFLGKRGRYLVENLDFVYMIVNFSSLYMLIWDTHLILDLDIYTIFFLRLEYIWDTSMYCVYLIASYRCY